MIKEILIINPVEWEYADLNGTPIDTVIYQHSDCAIFKERSAYLIAIDTEEKLEPSYDDISELPENIQREVFFSLIMKG